MNDIIYRVAWTCGDSDCKTGWHVSNYWSGEDGYTVDNYSDGDHEAIEESELPTPEREQESWLEYAKHVAATGLDPLGQYMLACDNRKIKRAFVAEVAEWIGAKRMGLLLGRVRVAGKWVSRHDAPQNALDFLCAERGKLPEFKSIAELKEGAQGCRVTHKRGALKARVYFTMEVPVVWPEARRERELQKMARKHLREKSR